MKLDEALTLRMSFNDLQGEIRVDENGYICLNDLAQYFPNKRIDNWKRLDSTIEFTDTLERKLNTSDVRELKKAIVTRRGKYNGGTYAHELLALDFCMWISSDFRYEVYNAYKEGSNYKKNWNIKRELASYNYKLMSKSVEESHDPAKFYHYSNEAKMLNVIVFGKHEKGVRENATEKQLDDIAWLESKNSAYIDINMSYEERKETLTKLFEARKNERQKRLD